jgi:8-oxo-dGTP diphosphatase
MKEIRSGYYRVSVKALILNESRDKFLIAKKENGSWGIPGGGLDWGESVRDGLIREIEEEMHVKTTWIGEHPSYFLTSANWKGDTQVANIFYEVTLESLNFTPTRECIEVRFVDKEEIKSIDMVKPGVKVFAKQFDPKRHVQ